MIVETTMSRALGVPDRDKLVERYAKYVDITLAKHAGAARGTQRYEDLVAYAWEGLAVALDTYNPLKGTTLRTWVIRQIRHRLGHADEARKKFSKIDQYPSSLEEGITDDSTDASIMAATALACLTTRQRQVMLRIMEGESCAAIGRALGLSRERVRVIRDESLVRMRGVLE